MICVRSLCIFLNLWITYCDGYGLSSLEFFLRLSVWLLLNSISMLSHWHCCICWSINFAHKRRYGNKATQTTFQFSDCLQFYLVLRLQLLFLFSVSCFVLPLCFLLVAKFALEQWKRKTKIKNKNNRYRVTIECFGWTNDEDRWAGREQEQSQACHRIRCLSENKCLNLSIVPLKRGISWIYCLSNENSISSFDLFCTGIIHLPHLIVRIDIRILSLVLSFNKKLRVTTSVCVPSLTQMSGKTDCLGITLVLIQWLFVYK